MRGIVAGQPKRPKNKANRLLYTEIAHTQEGSQMSKANKRRGNREAKKPKKVKEKVLATADSTKAIAMVNAGQKKRKIA